MLKSSLIFRIIVMNVLLLTVGIGIFTAFHYKRDRQNMLELTIDGAEILMATIENAIFNSKCKGDSKKLQSTLEFISNSPNLRGVRIFNPDTGLVINSSVSEEIDQPVLMQELETYRSGKSSALFEDKGEEILGIVRPIRSRALCQECHGREKAVLGVLNLNYSMLFTTEKLAKSSRCFSLSMVFITVLLSIGVSVILIRYVRKPIQVMTRRMARVEQGEKNVRMVPKYHDEISYLMHSFNSMLDRLETAQKELEEFHFQQMEQADRLASIGEMATGMAHEIKNPLAGISGAVTVLADDFPPGDERRQVVQDILAQIARLNKTASDLLNFGRPGLPQHDYLNLNDLVKETLFFVAQHPEAKNVTQQVALDDELPPVWVDRKQVQQVLLNIMINALQSMPDGGVLNLRSGVVMDDATPRSVEVTIGDTGKGIAADQLEKIFTPFFTTKLRGTGLGLSICRQLVKQNAGHLEVESALGQGTTFTLTFPAATLAESGPQEEPHE
ncbi:MAG: HAMP domain-containing protein [Desulfuromonadaceae bacterium]|nr:HAMP domain-containing protein [Desulfuromonadaceae bacterium]